MRIVAVASLFCFASTIANAQSNLPPGFVVADKPILCGPGSTIFKNLANKELNEKPIWVGQDENKNNFAVFMNPQNGGFTILQFGEQIACILGLGPKSELFNINTKN